MTKLPHGMIIKERTASGGDAGYESIMDSILADIGYTAGVIALAVSMLNRLSPSQQNEIMQEAHVITKGFMTKMMDENGGSLDYRHSYEIRATLANQLFKKLADKAEAMPQKTEEEILEEVVFAMAPAAGVT